MRESEIGKARALPQIMKNTTDTMATAVARYYHCQAKVRQCEAANMSQRTIDNWYRQMFRAEDRMRAMGI